MLYGPMTHPQFLRALAAAGHGSKILLADANYPHTTGVNPRCELISLNLAPGLLDVSQVLDVLKRTIPIERAEIMTPAPDAEPVEIPIHDEFRAALPEPMKKRKPPMRIHMAQSPLCSKGEPSKASGLSRME